MMYQIYKNFWDEWVILSLELDDEIAKFDTRDQAENYLNLLTKRDGE